LHTTNNLIIKKFVSFGPEIEGYAPLAEHTARIFRDLFSEYTAECPADICEAARPSIFQEAKSFFDFVKEFHADQSYDVRLSILDYPFQNRALGAFFGGELARCKRYILKKIGSENADYTTSLAWDMRCTTLCQTRTLGYLPRYLIREKISQFKEIVTRKVEKPDPNKLNLIRSLVWNELQKTEVPQGILGEPKIRDDIIRESVILELKHTASTTQTVSSGGKLEDARSYLQKIRENKWIFPIRDLNTFEITGYTPIISIGDDSGDINLSSVLFWFSCQITLNFLIRRRLWKHKLHYFPILIGKKEFHIDNLLDCGLVTINEPGKARILVKSMSAFSWVMVPAAKISQKVLSKAREHKAGLELGSHDWHHTKRISGESPESAFMYSRRTGKLHDNIIMGYMDWTEATDRMTKMAGIAHLQSFWAYIRFPKIYGELILTIIREPQPVREELVIHNQDTDPEIICWKGTINEGFMMGNQMTKTILHLSHLSQRALAEKYLNSKGIVVKRTDPNQNIRRAARQIYRRIESSVLTRVRKR
jgi:hypothetical protein